MRIVDTIYVMKDIETSFDVSSIKYENIQIWPYIRVALIMDGYREDNGDAKNKMSRFEKAGKLFRAVLNSDIRLLFKKNGILIFDDDFDYCIMNGKVKTRLFEAIRELYGERCIPITIPYNHNKSPYTNHIDAYLLSFLIMLERKKIRYDTNKLQGKTVLDKILERLDIREYDVDGFIKRVLSGKQFFYRLLSKNKPQKLFVSTYYDFQRMPAVAVANELGIDTIELQHGYIGYDHIPFQAFARTSRECYPRYFLSFGEKFSRIISDNIYDSCSIFEIGNGYLEYIKGYHTSNREIFRKKYKAQDKILICVVGIGLKEYDLHIIKLSLELLTYSDKYMCIFLPRNGKIYDIAANGFYYETEYSVYQGMQACDITLSNMSTCVVESLYLGTPVVLDNYDDSARIYYDGVFDEIEMVKYVKGGIDLEKSIGELINVDREAVHKEGQLFYADGNKDKVRQAMLVIDHKHS